MAEQEQSEPTFKVEYYRLDGGEVGRVKHDLSSDEYLDGEVFQGSRGWSPCPTETVLGEGEQISHREAKKLVKRLGGRL